MSVKVVVFDLWNTLIYDSSKENHEKMARLLGFENRQEFWDYCDSYFFHRNQKFYDFLKELIEEKNLPEETFDKIKELWEDSKNYVNVFPETISTLERLKKKHKLAIISNSAEEEANESLEKLNLKKYFDYIVLSCKVELAKPDPRIFQLVLDHFKVKLEECVMIGDNLEVDVIPARMLGMKGILIDTRKKYLEYKDENWYITSLNELKL
ncbi:MAG: HAD family hydrolase [Candidatus Aenigmarchaeota archaeon]|nr:HAD family hydrolase [Candidatus Aenigmarchaeota archaeon]